MIPNSTRAEKLFQAAAGETGAQSSTLRRRVGNAMAPLSRRSKSLTKGHWDEIVFNSTLVRFPAYERVQLRHPGFYRPVVLYGPLADIAQEQLLKDFPLRFALPECDNSANLGVPNAAGTSGIVRLSAIKSVMNRNKHCLLDITPGSVERLQYAQYCPIVIYLYVDSRSRLRDLRKGHSKAAASKNSRKLMEHAAKLNKQYSFLFSGKLIYLFINFDISSYAILCAKNNEVGIFFTIETIYLYSIFEIDYFLNVYAKF